MQKLFSMKHTPDLGNWWCFHPFASVCWASAGVVVVVGHCGGGGWDVVVVSKDRSPPSWCFVSGQNLRESIRTWTYAPDATQVMTSHCRIEMAKGLEEGTILLAACLSLSLRSCCCLPWCRRPLSLTPTRRWQICHRPGMDMWLTTSMDIRWQVANGLQVAHSVMAHSRYVMYLSFSIPRKPTLLGAVIELKKRANALFRKSWFSDALFVYQSILQQISDSIPAPFTRVIRCNIAACFIELSQSIFVFWLSFWTRKRSIGIDFTRCV